MESSKISIKHLVIAIIVMTIFFYAGYGYIKDNSRENTIPTREEVLEMYPMFEAIKKIDPEKFESLYKEIKAMPYTDDKDVKNKYILKVLASINVWFDSKIGNLLNSASDEAVNKYGNHFINSIDVLLKNDPTGVQCFNTVYPGMIGDLDVFKLEDDIKGMAKKAVYLNAIADSIARGDKIDRLPVEQVEEAFSIINDKLVIKYGEDYYVEDPKELAKQPSLICRKTLDLLREVLALDPHLSAEILRYIRAPE
ncbi:hypothetical protein [Xenorhabdus szentirmaii]|uniref:hypothetical protein n=1 Tax=Xenorhabdus szentirmaii TaxID=290112 RepID=UPI0019ABC814|nr:hypothetical protein [Xenorhabdus sp. 38]MBD2782511.1 hypothetical protein [Xenorhabdus sp. 38]